MPTWDFVLTDANGNALTDLAEATNRSLTFTRNGVPEVTASISHEDEPAGLILNALSSGIPLLKCYRNGVLRFHGYLAPFQEQLEDATTLDLTFRGPLGQLLGDGDERGFYAAGAFTATNDAGVIAQTALAAANTLGFAAIKSTSMTIESTQVQIVDYTDANIGQIIADLSALDGGYDFEVAPVENYPELGVLHVYASQGSVKQNAIFEYGPDTARNVRSVTRQTAPPINYVRVIGGQSLGKTLKSIQQDTTSQGTYGVFPIQTSAPDCQIQQHLDAYAKSLLRRNPVRTVSFQPEAALSPLPWDDFWIGDTVTFRARRGNFSQDTTIRVDEIKLLIDDEGNETFDLSPTGAGPARADVISSVSARHSTGVHGRHSTSVRPDTGITTKPGSGRHGGTPHLHGGRGHTHGGARGHVGGEIVGNP